MREKDPSDACIVGIYYDQGRLYLFDRRKGKYLRLDEAKNAKGEASGIGHLSLHLPDPYAYLPSLEVLERKVHGPAIRDRSKRTINDLEVITSIAAPQVRDALSGVLREMDRVGLVNQRGYAILVQAFALKLFDEMRNASAPREPLRFYVTAEEAGFSSLRGGAIKVFIARMQAIREDALVSYESILGSSVIDWKEPDHIRVLASACQQFQDFSFVRSSKRDLYQLVFYNFANRFAQQEHAQFLTPLKVIEFLVQIVNPRGPDTVIDPAAESPTSSRARLVHSHAKGEQRLEDSNLVGSTCPPT